MRNKRSRTIFMGLLAVIVILATGCQIGGSANSGEKTAGGKETGTGSDAPIKMIVAQGGFSRSVEEAVAEFTRQTGIQVELLIYPYQESREKQILELRAGGSVDVVQIDGPIWLAELRDYLEPLVTYINKDSLDTGIYVPAMLEMFKNDGEIYALPYRVGGWVLIYRKDLFEAKGLTPPATFDEFVDTAVKLTDGDVFGFAGALKQGNFLVVQWIPFLYSRGGNILNEDMTAAAFNSPEGIESAQLLVDLYRKYKVMPGAALEYEQDSIISSMQQGIAAMSITYSPYFLEMNNPEKSAHAGNFAIAATLPYAENSGLSQGITEIAGWGFGINKDSKNKENAWKLIKFMTSVDEQLRLAVQFANSPTVQAVYEDERYLEVYPEAPAVLTSLLGAKTRPGTPQWANIEDILARELSAAVTGVKSVEQALSDAEKATNDLLK